MFENSKKMLMHLLLVACTILFISGCAETNVRKIDISGIKDVYSIMCFKQRLCLVKADDLCGESNYESVLSEENKDYPPGIPFPSLTKSVGGQARVWKLLVDCNDTESEVRVESEIKKPAITEAVLLAKAKKIPYRDYAGNIEAYVELNKINPSNNVYLDKIKKYENLLAISNSKKRNNPTELAILNKIKNTKPDDYDGLYSLYFDLNELYPSDQEYQSKLNLYDELMDSRDNSDGYILKTKKSSFNAYRNSSSQYLNTLNDLEKNGAFIKNDQSRSILVETSFWNYLDFEKKKAFCFMINETYPVYAHSILDKYSGKKLAEVDMFGDIGVIR